MADRRRQILQLYASRFDGLYLPSGSLRTQPGLAPGERRPCPTCGHGDRPGWIVDMFDRPHPCVTCGGKHEPTGAGGQWVAKDRGRGFVFVDRMDADRRPIGDQETKASARPRRRVLCDSCGGEGAAAGRRCERCDGDGKRDLHRFELRLDTGSSAGVDPLTASIVRRDQAGSYHELDVALADCNPRALRLLDDLYLAPVTRDEASLTVAERNLADLTLGYIDTRMPPVIRVPADVRDNDRVRREQARLAKGHALNTLTRERRDKDIRRHAREGRGPQWIGQQYGLSVSAVYQIVNGNAEAVA